ncbi:MAG: ABC transporter permease [Candidatus Limnocylindrales bacterium]
MLRSEARVSFRDASARPSSLGLLQQAMHEIASRRRLIRYLVQAEMKKRGSDTVLGNIWWVLDPLLQMVVYVIFVTIIARRSTPDYPLFIMAAILPWKWFSAAVTDATTSIVRQERLIRQIAFPKIVLPVATATSEVVGFAWGLVPLGLLLLLDAGRISPLLLWIPVIVGVQYVFTLGAAMVVAVGNVYFRDLGNVATHLLRLWWFLSPGLYSLASLDELAVVKRYPILHDIFAANPFATLLDSYRRVIYGTADGGLPVPPDLWGLAQVLLVSLIFLALATVFFKRTEPDFAKVL